MLSVDFCVSQLSAEVVAKKLRVSFHASADVVEKPNAINCDALNVPSVPDQSPDVEIEIELLVRESGALKVRGNS